MRKIHLLYLTIIVTALSLTLVPYSSAGIREWINKTITGKATSSVGANITIGSGGGNAPNISLVFNGSQIGGTLNEGPSDTNFTINFTVLDADGFGNLNSVTAAINVTKSGEDTRYNKTCSQYQSGGNHANYTCKIQMWWWDGSGVWNISVNISDSNGNVAVNNTVKFSVSETTGFVLAPQNLTWATLTVGAVNQTATNDPLLLNNTGNKDIARTAISLNATHLAGESDSSKALYSGNFSVGNTTSSSLECLYAGTSFATQLNYTLSGGSFVNISTAEMNASNFSLNNGREGQEQLYFCLLLVGSELTQQSYSTKTNGPWTVQAVQFLPLIKRMIDLGYAFPLTNLILENKNIKYGANYNIIK